MRRRERISAVVVKLRNAPLLGYIVTQKQLQKLYKCHFAVLLHTSPVSIKLPDDLVERTFKVTKSIGLCLNFSSMDIFSG